MYENITPPALPDYNPVGLYSYNGVELPALPEWDKTVYPYASISTKLGTISKYRYFWVYAEPVFATGNNATSTLAIPRPCLRWKLTDDNWVEDALSDDETLTSDGGFFGLWANYDVYYVDDATAGETFGFEPGTLYLAASEPVPVLAYPYSVMVYDYQKGADDWYQVHLYYSATPFTWNGKAVGNSGTVYKRIYDAAYDGWTEEAETEIEASPGLTGTTYQRIYTDHDIKDSAGNIWLAAGSVTEAVETVTEKWLRSFRVGLALGLTGKLLPVQEETVIAVQLQNVLYIKKAPAEVSGSTLILWGGKGA